MPCVIPGSRRRIVEVSRRSVRSVGIPAVIIVLRVRLLVFCRRPRRVAIRPEIGQLRAALFVRRLIQEVHILTKTGQIARFVRRAEKNWRSHGRGVVSQVVVVVVQGTAWN